MTALEDLKELYDSYHADDKFRNLREPGIFFVGGWGSIGARYMLIGEAPGRLENAKKKPFQGRAGQNLVEILKKVGIPQDDTFMTNIVKYWPRDGRGHTRNPDPWEIYDSRDYILKEIEIVQPQIVGLCGRSAITAIFPKMRDVFHNHGQLLDGKFVPLYHPAYATWNTMKKPLVISGYVKLKEHLESSVES